MKKEGRQNDDSEKFFRCSHLDLWRQPFGPRGKNNQLFYLA